MNDIYTLQQKLKDHIERKPIYPLYGDVSLDEHVAWDKAFRAWEREKIRLEILIANSSPKTYVYWDAGMRQDGSKGFNPEFSRPKGICAETHRARWAKITPKDDAHAKRLETQARYREKKKLKKMEAENER